jgi:AcrR family transcriptional regulator
MAAISAVRRPQQERSRRSHDRLVRGALAILAERPFDEVSVAEIAKSAGLTVGGFYARFGSKEALLAHLEQTLADEMRALAAGIGRRAGAGGVHPIELVRMLVKAHARLYRRHRSVLRTVVQRARGEARARERLRELSRETYAVVARALEKSGSIAHGEVRPALEFALYAERSVLREAILFGEGWAKERRWSDRRIVDETVRLVARYLGIDEEPRARRARKGGSR